jgi:glycosyltransferase involved in cell wall biosynthesis
MPRSRAIRVLRIIARLNVGGPARHVVWLNEGLAADGFEPLLVTGTVSGGEVDMSDFAISRGISPVVIPHMGREISAHDAMTIWHLWRLMVRFSPDLVHTHTAKAGAVGRLAGLLYRFVTPGSIIGRPRRCGFVHTYHGHVFHSYYGAWKTRIFLNIDRLLARVNTDRLIVLGPQQLGEIRDRFRVGRPRQFAVVPLGIDLTMLRVQPDARQRLRLALGISASETVVGIVGRLTAIKNHDLFLRVASRIGHLARFVVFGDGGDRARLEQRAFDLGLGDRVVFAGMRSVEEVYASLDVVALSSRNEGTPLSIIEAMASGKPVISTAVGGVVDLLGPLEERVTAADGTSFDIRQRGITVAPDDEAAFATGLARLLTDEGLRRRLIERGVAYVQQNHLKERLIADITRLYREVAARER